MTNTAATLNLTNRHPESGVIRLPREQWFRITDYTNDVPEPEHGHTYHDLSLVVQAMRFDNTNGTVTFYGVVPGMEGLYEKLTHMGSRNRVIFGMPAKTIDELVANGVPRDIAGQLVAYRRTKRTPKRPAPVA